jgi:UDP-glucose 4-epimerase
VRVVVTGASGNVGTSLMPLLRSDGRIDSVVGVARRTEGLSGGGEEWRAADIGVSDLRPILEGADTVVHLAWAIQPSHDEKTLWRTNVLGSRRLFEAAAAAGVKTIVHASSVGAYAPAPSEATVDESWPVDGHPTSFYSRHKATVEWLLGSFQNTHPDIRVVSMRPSLIFKREAATGIRRLFIGPLLPSRLMRRGALPGIPDVGVSFQATHSTDVAAAFLEAIHRPVSGPFNVSAEPALTLLDVAEILDAKTFKFPLPAVRAAAKLSWAIRLQPTPPSWLDMAASAPTISAARATRELGWHPHHTSTEALAELLAGLANKSDLPTPPLSRESSGFMRRREVAGTVHRPEP